LTKPALPDVLQILPHRPPFLFVDQALHLDERRVTAERTFRAEEPSIQGHFPDRLLVPGVLLLEGLAQTMAYGAICRGASPDLLLVGIDAARFRRPLEPPVRVVYEVDFEEERFGLVKARGRVLSGEQRVLDAVLSGFHRQSSDGFG
jgi:3-hydroxyacyl-[acyl-carrier-protein] dehydratase